MPLKHFTETFLVVVLGVVVALTGLLTATLPPLPQGALPWTVLFVLSVIYPLSLHSLFQKRRADNFFRKLHWIPAAILLVWLALQGVALGSQLTFDQVSVYTWGWTLVPVIVSFILIVTFCLKVIRRRVPRLTFLALILVPFTALALLSEQGGEYEKELTAALWGADFWNLDESGVLTAWIGSETQSGKNLEVSQDPAEEKWRERLRKQKEREQEIAARMEEESSSSSQRSLKSVGSTYSVTSFDTMASVSSRPTKLPDSGFGWHIIISLLVIGYSAVLHRRTALRRVSW